MLDATSTPTCTSGPTLPGPKERTGTTSSGPSVGWDQLGRWMEMSNGNGRGVNPSREHESPGRPMQPSRPSFSTLSLATTTTSNTKPTDTPGRLLSSIDTTITTQMAPLLACKPPFATNEPDSYYEAKDTPNYHAPPPKPDNLNKRTIAYHVYDNYLAGSASPNTPSPSSHARNP